jgi:hypothetical protein
MTVIRKAPRLDPVQGMRRLDGRRDAGPYRRPLKVAQLDFKQTAQSVIPGDPEASAYRFIIVASKRARQLQNGARSFCRPRLRNLLCWPWKKYVAAWCNTNFARCRLVRRRSWCVW